MLIHANHQWKMSVNAHLWLYAVWMPSKQINFTPRMQSVDEKSLMQKFVRTDSHTNVKHWDPFGSPVYVLESALRKQGYLVSGKAGQNIRIYLGQWNVVLVLNQQTGLVSPQFHV
jgi:hypothetical protein